MKKMDLEKELSHIFEICPGNRVADPKEFPEGIDLFEEPIFGIGSAGDALFPEYKREDVIGPWYMTPEEWLPGAKSVISLFFPFTESVKKEHRSCQDKIASAWLYGRIEGQSYIGVYMEKLAEWFEKQGIHACVPALDSRFRKVMAGNDLKEYACVNEKTFGSNWSERHTAYACGLGTFGLSKGLITKKGIAGRFGSVIIDAGMEPDERPYTGLYDYCINCGVCIRRCPAGAITLEHGKDHNICGERMNQSKVLYAPRLGCGLCQTAVPCESGIPVK